MPNTSKIISATALAAAALGPAALVSAQPFTIVRHSITAGGATAPSAGGPYGVAGSIGQPIAGSASGGPYACTGGFWGEPGMTGPPSCYANCDGSTNTPILNVLDFICFQSRYAQADPAANCDGSTNPPILNVLDFICFQSLYAQGCP